MRERPARHERDFAPDGFEWIEPGDGERSITAFLRRPAAGRPPLLVACNLTPVPRENVVLGVPEFGRWRELLNTDASLYGGAGWGNLGGVETSPLPAHGRPHSIRLTLPPLSALVLEPEPNHGQVPR
jgi:1,4-alpha-glucan branching enzyme